MIGVCCQWLESFKRPRSGDTQYVNVVNERSLQLGRYVAGKYSYEQIFATYRHNVQNLIRMLPRISMSGIRLFRISSSLFPLVDKVDKSTWDNDEIRNLLRDVGDIVKRTGIRITTHPGQFCVLSSDSDRVVENSFNELSFHGWVFDTMGLDRSPKYAINIHGGKSDRSERLIEQIKSLPQSVSSRLTLENDESAYSLVDLLSVHKETGVPVVWDSHHHVFNDDGITLDDAYTLAKLTWPSGITPLQHISNTEPAARGGSFTERRKHSNMIHYIPDSQLQGLRDDTVACEIEAKMKNIAVVDMANMFSLSL